MLPQDIVDVADRWWASELGCDASAEPVVSMPPDLVRRLEPRACRWSARLVLDTSEFLLELHDVSVEKVIGPAFIGYGTASVLRLSAAKSARAVGSGDDGAVAKLRDSCSVEEWEHGGSDHRSGTAFGAFNSHGELCSLAGFERWGDRIGHISVVSTPEYRGLMTRFPYAVVDRVVSEDIVEIVAVAHLKRRAKYWTRR
jgi:hypothetical protein